MEWVAWNLTLHRFEIPLEEWTVACAPFAIVLNAIVLYIAFRYVNIRDKLSQCFVILMTVSDLTNGIVYMATKQYVDCFPRAFCGVYYFIVWLTNMLSMLALVFLNVDKYIYVGKPLRYHLIVTPRVVALEIFAGFALSLGMCFLLYFEATSYSEYHAMRGLAECRIYVKPLFYAMFVILFYIVPTLICLAISFYIFGVAQKSMRERMKRAASIRRRTVSTSAAAAGANQALMALLSQSAEERAAAADRRKLFKQIFFVFASTVFTSVTVLPYRIALSIYSITHASPMIDVVYALWFLLPLSAVLNPIITVVTQRQYRNGLRKMFKGCGLGKSLCRRRSRETEVVLGVCSALANQNRARDSCQPLRSEHVTYAL